MMDRITVLDLAEQANKLEDYINNKVVDSEGSGLCDNVLDLNFPYHNVFNTWEHFNGSWSFPVEKVAYEYSSNERKHDRRTKYGKLRLSLAKHCLEWTLTQLREVV